ncbi:MAG: VOC family protein [Bacteroidota bacterium]
MKFRHARHTNDLAVLTEFYTAVLGLEELGRFENHSGYNGVFLGFPHLDWHLEFTESEAPAEHHPDQDDLLVFYLSSEEGWNAIRRDAERLGIKTVPSRNPYWQAHGVELRDPDNFGVVLCREEVPLRSRDAVTQLVVDKGVDSWDQFLKHVRAIPYGRNSSRTDFGLVVSEDKGTCSSKHALIKQVADRNQIGGVELIMGMYKMSEANTPGIGRVLSNNGLAYIPEAHCYLRVHGKRLDLTNPHSDLQKILPDLLEEQLIEPEQVGTFKVEFHQAYVTRWIAEEGLDRSFAEVWKVREDCIAALARG